jgi:methionine sulfoxide reductase heme-binding subunit
MVRGRLENSHGWRGRLDRDPGGDARGTSVEQIRVAVRITGIVGFLFFTLPFTASAWSAMAPSGVTRWLRSRRRYLGITFAIAMAIHVSLVIWLVRVSPKVPAPPIIFIVGGIGYGFIAALFVTSFDAPTDWLGPRRWRRLHVMGLWYLWMVFVLVFAGGLLFAPMLYSLLLAIAFGAAAMRWAHRRRRIALRIAAVAARAS